MAQLNYQNTTEEDYSIEDFKREYGSCFHGLNTREKRFLVKRLGYQLCQEARGTVRTSELVGVLRKLEKLPDQDRLTLIKELANE